MKRWKRTEDGVYWPAFVDVLTALLVVMLLVVGSGPTEKLKRLEAENAALKKENAELKTRIVRLENQVDRQLKRLSQRSSDEFVYRRLHLRLQKAGPELEALIGFPVSVLGDALSIVAREFGTLDSGAAPPETPEPQTQRQVRALLKALRGDLLEKWSREREIELGTVRVHATGALGPEARYLNGASEGIVNWLSGEAPQFGFRSSAIGSSVDYLPSRRLGKSLISVRLHFRLTREATAAAIRAYGDGLEP